jgi:tetratricopeptide (TPR) repeat protein
LKTSAIQPLSILAIILLGLVVYSNTFFNSFHFDDFPDIINNASIRDLHHLTRIWNFWPTRFITYLTLALNYHWGGLQVAGYHVLNLLFHLGASILVWYLVTLTMKTPFMKNEGLSAQAPWIAFISAVLFLVHPLQTQPVNYIYQRAVLLAAFFYLGALALYVKSALVREINPASRAWIPYYIAALVFAILSPFSKETAVTLPFMVCLYQRFFLTPRRKFPWVMAVPFFMAALLLPVVWLIVHPVDIRGAKSTVEGYAGGITVGTYFLTQIKVLVTYIRLAFLPIHQSVDYDYPAARSLFEVPVILSLLLLTAVLTAAGKLAGKYRMSTFGIFWFFITLMPESSLWPNKDLVFEHRLYLPVAGFSMFLSSGIFYLFKNKNFLSVRFFFLLVCAYSFLTYQRNKVWENEVTLWDDAVHQFPRDQRAYLNRGAAYQVRGEIDRALADYNMVIGLGSVDAVTLSNRGKIFLDKRQPELALANFDLAIKVNPNFAGTYMNRGLLYAIYGKLNLAMKDFNREIELLPGDPQAYLNRAKLYELEGDHVHSAWDLQKAGSLSQAQASL